MRQRVKLSAGWADANIGPRSFVRVGDRMVPKAIEVTFPGVDRQPGLRMSLAVVNGRPQCRSLTIEAVEDGREVMQLDLRAVSLAAWIEDIFGLFAAEVLEEKGGRVTAVVRAGGELAGATAVSRARTGRGNRKVTEGLLDEVAAVYRAHPKAPLQAVADEFGVSRRQASNYRKLAADAGKLPQTTQGRKAF